MQIGILSDTHDNVTATERATAIFESEGVDVLIHCGDFVAPVMIPYFEGFELHAVLGNNDGDGPNLAALIEELGHGSELHGRFADLEFDGVSFAVLHGESLAEVDAIAAGETYDVVCYGHHHERDLRADGRTTVINPGAHFGAVDDDQRTVAIVDTLDQSVRFRSVLE